MELSIIIPVYNAEKYIRECLDSVINKKYDCEVILVNDGSSDSSLTICEEYSRKDNRIKIINKNNGGVSSARNAGLLHATGRYVMFLDADDYFTEDAFEYIDKYIKCNKYDFVAMSYSSLFEDMTTDLYEYNIEEQVTNQKSKIDEILYTSSDLNTCWGKLFLREKIIDNNITFRTDLPIGEDYIFVADYYKYCKNVLLSNESILFYRQHSESAMRRYDIDRRIDYTGILLEYNKNAIKENGNMELIPKMNRYYLSVITNIFFEFAKSVEDKKELRKMYTRAVRSSIVESIVNELSKSEIKELYKKIEYSLIKSGKVTMLIEYFRFKAAYARRIKN